MALDWLFTGTDILASPSKTTHPLLLHRERHNALQPALNDDVHPHRLVLHVCDRLMGRQLADLWLRCRDAPPLDHPNRALPHLQLPFRRLPERRLPPRLDLLAFLSAVRRRLLASRRPDLPRPVCRRLELHAGQAEAYAQKCALLPGPGRFVLSAFYGRRLRT